MEHKLENEVLTFYLEGELNSYNAIDVEKEIDNTIGKNNLKAIVLDLEKLRYISSAGLRIVVRLKQRFDDTSIINVSDDVYNVFEMVGFHNFINIKKL